MVNSTKYKKREKDMVNDQTEDGKRHTTLKKLETSRGKKGGG